MAGGAPWPPAGSVSLTVAGAPGAASAQPAGSVREVAVAPTGVAGAVSAGTASASASFETVAEQVTLRQGLPRVAGGELWPPAGTVTVERAVVEPSHAPNVAASEAPVSEPAPVSETVLVGEAVPASEVLPVASPAVAEPVLVRADPRSAEAAPVVAAASAAGASASTASATAVAPKPTTKPKRVPVVIKGRPLAQWVRLGLLWGVGAVLVAGVIVLAARGLTTFQVVRDFLVTYPGEYELPEFVDPGFPWWARWSHFLNFFLMVLIIRSGLLVRQQQKPDAFFTPKKGGKKISIYLWLHTSLDVLWLVNGVVFVVMLFVSGHWARIVPTSWEVFPNALSAGIQYLTLEWPHEDGWVNYNSLQQLMYFAVVFIAAPLAAITGVRMSEWWPKDTEKLNKWYPAPVARAVHFPVMLFFVLFIIVHVFLVFTTGALKNLNHMFVGTPEPSWLGFWLFAAGLLVTVGVTWLARPLVLAPIASAFGRVSER